MGEEIAKLPISLLELGLSRVYGYLTTVVRKCLLNRLLEACVSLHYHGRKIKP